MKRSIIVVALVAVLATLVATTAAFAGGPKDHTLYRYVGQLQTQDRLVRHDRRAERQSRCTPKSLLGQPRSDIRHDRKTVFMMDGRDAAAVVASTTSRRTTTWRSTFAPIATPISNGQAKPGSDGRRPRPDAEQAVAAALSLPRHPRLGRRRKGDDHRQGREPARAEADDRPGRPTRRSRPARRPCSCTGIIASRR